MKITDSIVGFYNQNLWLLKSALEDFSDAEMFVRPCEGANHTMWQMGHFITSEANMVNAVKPGAITVIPEGFAEKFTKDQSKIDDPGMFPSKAEVIKVIESVRSATLEWVKSLTEDDLPKPGPAKMLEFIPTVGHMVLLLPDHLAMHLGQVQVIRRKLGKPHVM